MRLAVLALDGCFDTGLSVIREAFGIAKKLSPLVGIDAPKLEITLVGVRKKVRSALGLSVPVEPVTPSRKPDWIIVPALYAPMPEEMIAALARPDVKDANAALRKWHGDGAKIAASCMGTFVVAETGLLDGQTATTTWFLAPLFRQRYPQVRLDETRILVPSEIGVTAGAAMGHLDLALWLIAKSSPALADMVSRYLLADIRSSQAAYIIPNHLARADPVITRFEQWARKNLKAGFSLNEAADALAITPRSLQRKCEAVLGKSPLSYFQDLRVERARTLLHGSGLSVDAIAAEVGYVDGATLRTLLRQRLGRGVRELRADLR
ncbi:MAG TPA: helix-turn-helix domain-containing protein [Rhizomicrobium sp.]|jgi:transcriptional regulator GlxA family with amidase domain|nr:helix-turn-helix domain-containing protein [Rhizomicrobium sp.]